MYQYFILFYGQIILHGMDRPYFVRSSWDGVFEGERERHKGTDCEIDRETEIHRARETETAITETERDSTAGDRSPGLDLIPSRSLLCFHVLIPILHPTLILVSFHFSF